MHSDELPEISDPASIVDDSAATGGPLMSHDVVLPVAHDAVRDDGFDQDGEVSTGLRTLTRVLETTGADPCGGGVAGSDGYGTRFENDVFGMHPYCWCERSDCPWCAVCRCEGVDYEYRIDGWSTDFERFMATGGFGGDGLREAIAVGEHRCEFVRNNRLIAPNFWHKPSRSWVRWYKYIGRSQEFELNISWEVILTECLASVPSSVPDEQREPKAPGYGPIE